MSMTGFGARQASYPHVGRVRVEIRSTNHKFLETVLHLPEGFLSFEEKVKKEIESQLRRGRVICVIDVIDGHPKKVAVNKPLLGDYLRVMKAIQSAAGTEARASLDTLMRLPGVVVLSETTAPSAKVWSAVRSALQESLKNLVRARQSEGAALQRHLQSHGKKISRHLEIVKSRFSAVVRRKLKGFASDEEKSSFLKSSDITEELERLAFHVKNFSRRLSQGGAIGKELDFIAQEMQREANTMGAKSCDPAISGEVILIKSQIEKVREQAQNVE
ncbi:MAG: YicC family protein [Candidatus Omnitrophica bacterium]|nr:YicC family protein [Candidatus Omnitrophota bacterium]